VTQLISNIFPLFGREVRSISPSLASLRPSDISIIRPPCATCVSRYSHSFPMPQLLPRDCSEANESNSDQRLISHFLKTEEESGRWRELIAENLPTEIFAGNCQSRPESDFLRDHRFPNEAAGARFSIIRARYRPRVLEVDRRWLDNVPRRPDVEPQVVAQHDPIRQRIAQRSEGSIGGRIRTRRRFCCRIHQSLSLRWWVGRSRRPGLAIRLDRRVRRYGAALRSAAPR